MKKLFNYKFAVWMVFPALGIGFSLCFVFFTPGVGLYLGVSVLFLSLLCATALMIYEPIYYIIDSEAFTAVGIFKRHCTPWKQVRCIRVTYDPFVNSLLIKDYRLETDISSGHPDRFLRIMKCSKTKMLIKQYALTHGIDIFE